MGPVLPVDLDGGQRPGLDPVEVQDAIEVIDLVPRDPGGQPESAQERGAVLVECLHADGRVAGDAPVRPGTLRQPS